MASGVDDGFRDPGLTLGAFTDPILVRCPTCGSRATVQASGPVGTAWWQPPRRLVCPGCALIREWPPDSTTIVARSGSKQRVTVQGGVASVGGARDPFFGCDLWLQTPCREHVLWFYNHDHLELVAEFVTARLRRRATPASRKGAAEGFAGRSTMLERLPAWMKSAKNRGELEAAIDRLRDSQA